jgi:glucose-1-phosphate cytidylyltransferase
MINTLLILAGGKGTRFLELTRDLPKPMILANGTPLIERVITHYINFGIKEIFILGGYKHNLIFQYFSDKYDFDGEYFLINNVKIKIIDTGIESLTGKRISIAMQKYKREQYLLTYSDGISDVDIAKLVKFHNSHKGLATVTAVKPPKKFGQLSTQIDTHKVIKFGEKVEDDSVVNGGYFVIEHKVLDFIPDYNIAFEQEPLEQLASSGNLYAYRHEGYWQCVDTIRELEILESDIKNGKIT